MNDIVYAVGGRARRNPSAREEWRFFEKAVAVKLDLATGRGETVFEYETPPEFRPDEEPSILFKAATRTPDRLYACTQTEVLILSLPDFELIARVSHPAFNDVHHVLPADDGTFHVVSTGLDLVMKMNEAGEVLAEYSTLDEPPFTKFDRDTDYRKIATTKPHRTHPNFLFYWEDEPWATRFEQKDAVRLSNLSDRMALDFQSPHDGVVDGDRVYFTTIDGRVAMFDRAVGREAPTKVWNILEMARSRAPLGWCRGLKILDGGERALVGFSRLRSTKLQRNVAWARDQVRHGFTLGSLLARKLPLGTKVLLVDLKAERIETAFDLEVYGINAVFSVN